MQRKLKPAGRRPPHLFTCWSEIEARLRAAQKIALFLDFDGTLTPIRRRPYDAVVDAAVRRLLGRLARHRRVTLSFISGRRLRDLRARLRVPGAAYFGLHGLETGGLGAREARPSKPVVRARRLLTSRLAGLPGIWIDDKRLCFAVHYRGAAGGDVRRARAILLEVLAVVGSDVRVLEGKKIWEVLPRSAAGKGAAVKARLKQVPAKSLAIYVGDDVTDESAFAALPRALTVHVGRGASTQARYRLRSPAEVRQFLTRLEAEIARP